MNFALDLMELRAWRDRAGLVLFVRHGERESVPSHEFPRHDAPLTANGWREAESLGVMLSDRLGTVRSSPVPRCVATASAVIAGAKRRCAPEHDRLLGDPGAFVVDGDLAMSELVARGFHSAARQLGNGEAVPGFANPDLATSQLLGLAHSLLRADPFGVHLLVTHDLILATMAARIRGTALEEQEWPGFLHGLAMWLDDQQLSGRYGSDQRSIPNRLIPKGIG